MLLEMLKYFLVYATLASLVAGSHRKIRIVNGERIGTVVNGNVENPGNFPYIVYLRTITYFNKYDASTNMIQEYVKYGRCGGCIIRADLILTAAHCVQGAAPQNVTAFAGIVHTAKEQPSSQFIRGRRIVLHENYHSNSKDDIALIFLVNSFDISEQVNTISLGRPSNYQGGMNVSAVGWGRDVNGQYTQWLYRGDFEMWDRDECVTIVGYDQYEEYLCVIDPNFTMKICSGDSGGPLVSNNVLVGMSAATLEPLNEQTNGSCDPTYPSLFTNVSHYRNWINRKIAYDNMFFRYM